MSKRLSATAFLALQQPIFDVRSPGEFSKGHIPGSINLPLFSDEERALIGTLYKQVNRERATLEGLSIVGPKLTSLIETVLAKSDQKEIGVYCWRGGKRSESVSWLLNLYGFQVSVLEGGYKAFRQWVLLKHHRNLNIMVL